MVIAEIIIFAQLLTICNSVDMFLDMVRYTVSLLAYIIFIFIIFILATRQA